MQPLIHIRDYDPRWAEEFSGLRVVLAELLQGVATRIDLERRDVEAGGMSEAARRRRPRKVVRRDPALEDEILELIASGRSVRDVLSPARPAHLPSRAAFMAWVAESARAGCGDDDLADRYFQARQLRAGVLAEECLDIADGRLPITYAVPKGSEMEVACVDDHARVARDKLRVDTRKWFCAKLFGCSADLLGPDHDRGGEETTFADLAKLAEEAVTEDE